MTPKIVPILLDLVFKSLGGDISLLMNRGNLRIRLIVRIILTKYILLIRGLLKKQFIRGKESVSIQGHKFYPDHWRGFYLFMDLLLNVNILIKHEFSCIRKPINVVDVGAHVGYFTLSVKLNLPDARMYCFEPGPVSHHLLIKNLTSYSDVEVIQKVVSDRSSKVFFDHNEGNIAHSRIHIGSVPNKMEILLDSISLDESEVIRTLSYIDILKVDVENWENLVIKGAQNTLKKTKFLIIEVTILNNTNYSFSQLVSQLYEPNLFNFQLIDLKTYDYNGNIALLNLTLRNLLLS